MRLNEEEMRLRRDRIIEVAFQLFCDYGIDHVSMEQIAKQSGVGNRTMYRYFNNKTTLIIDVLAHQWNTLMAGIRAEIEYHSIYPSLTGYEQVSRWLDAFRSIYEQNAPLILFSYEAKLNVLRTQVRFTDTQKGFFTRGIREPFVAALEKGRADQTLSFPRESTEVFYAIWASIRGCFMLYGENNSYTGAYQVMTETFLKALRSN